MVNSVLPYIVEIQVQQLNLLYIRMFGEVVEQRAEADRGRLEPCCEEERPLQRWMMKYILTCLVQVRQYLVGYDSALALLFWG